MKPVSAEPMDPVYLIPLEVAALLRVKNAKSVYRWMKADPTMPALKIGGTVRFPRERLLAWLRAREQGHAQPRLPRPVHSVAKSVPHKAPAHA